MSKPDSTDAQGSFLSRIDVYTVMLGVALIAIILAIVLLAMELGRYEWDTKAQQAPRASWQGPVDRNLALDVPAAGLLDASMDRIAS